MNFQLTKNILVAAIALSSSFVFAQTYEVPVDGSNGEAEYAHFELKNFSVVQDGNTMKLKYELPLEITGVLNEVELSGVLDGSAVATLSGELGKATCSLTTSTCKIRYENLQLDAGRAQSLLQSMNLSPAELSARLSVGLQFRADPIGIVKFR